MVVVDTNNSLELAWQKMEIIRSADVVKLKRDLIVNHILVPKVIGFCIATYHFM